MTFERLTRAVPRLGILGASRVVDLTLTDQTEGVVEVVAVAARDKPRAQEFARARGIPRAYGSYDELLSDPEVDVVYVALPAAHHAAWCLKALAANKHVLCEKPFALSEAEARAVVEEGVRRQRLVMEGHHWRYHPLLSEFERLRPFCGPLSRIRARFDAPVPDGDIRRDPALGAGVFTDFGCYLVQWVQWALGREGDGQTRYDDRGQLVLRVEAAQARVNPPEVDETMEVRLNFPMGDSDRLTLESGATAELSCDMRPEVQFVAWLEIEGSDGLLHFENPLGIEGSYLELVPKNGRSVRTPAVGPSTFRSQLVALVRALATGEAPPTSGRSIIVTQRMMEDVYSKAGLAARVELAHQANGLLNG